MSSKFEKLLAREGAMFVISSNKVKLIHENHVTKLENALMVAVKTLEKISNLSKRTNGKNSSDFIFYIGQQSPFYANEALTEIEKIAELK